MQLRRASRQKAKIKLGLQGPSGAGKTMSALFIAYGLCGSWDKIAVIDTENRSSELYSHLGDFWVVPLYAPYSPERYIEAITTCLNGGIEVIIIDSTSHEWEGIGGILDVHGSMAGNSFTNWAKLTPRHNSFINFLLQADAHIIATLRSKQEYVLTDKNGKQVPEKVGLKGVQREGLDYELTLMLELDISLHAKATKDRTGLFFKKPEFIPSTDTGIAILQWCNNETPILRPIENDLQFIGLIQACKSTDELLHLYNSYPTYQEAFITEFTKRRQELSSTPKQISSH